MGFDSETLELPFLLKDLKVVRSGQKKSLVLDNGGTTSLKTVAPLAGHGWEVDDPGGGLSMLCHDTAVGDEPETSESTRTWLLDCKRGDGRGDLADPGAAG